MMALYTSRLLSSLFLSVALLLICKSGAFMSIARRTVIHVDGTMTRKRPSMGSWAQLRRTACRQLRAKDKDDAENEAERLRKEAERLREQIRNLELSIGERRVRQPPPSSETAVLDGPMSLQGKRVLVVGANGRLGSMVCRYLLRNHPQTQVVACCHVIGEDSTTARGYGRLQYEVGAEDGIGSIGAAWSAEDRSATFKYADYMKDYDLQNIRLVEAELLDPVQCNTICEEIDSVIWCATDFNGNKPRSISGLNVAFLFRAVADPTKGRVEIEGLRNLLGGFKNQRSRGRYSPSESGDVMSAFTTSSQRQQRKPGRDPINFVLVSASPDSFRDFETPFGTFHGIKREGEDILKEFPSLTSTVLQMAKYEDTFVQEDLDVNVGAASDDSTKNKKRRINRRDAARAVVEALTNEDLIGTKVQVWTAPNSKPKEEEQ